MNLFCWYKFTKCKGIKKGEPHRILPYLTFSVIYLPDFFFAVVGADLPSAARALAMESRRARKRL
jgi:hypothetical protein